MRYVHWARTRVRRLLIILLAIMIYFLLLIVDALAYFPHFMSNSTPYWLPWMRFGFSAFVALMFLAVGALVWLYARSRLVALLLFGFSFTMMVTFAVETDAALNDTLPVLSTIGTVATVLALFMLSTLLLLFPKNLLLWRVQSSVDTNNVAEKLQSSWQRYYLLLLRPYLAVLTLRGVILAVAPLLLLTVIPQALGLPSQYVLNSQLSTITVSLLPLALGYTILRYQVLIFDMYIRRAVAWIVGGVGLAVLGYLVITLSSVLLSTNIAAYVVGVVAVMAVLGPCVWWLAHAVTERFFFSEILHYRRLIDNPDIMADEAFDLNEASRLITLAAVNVFETQEVCLFVLDEDTGYYRIYPTFTEDDPNDAPRRPLVQRLLGALRPAAHTSTDRLEANELLIKRVAGAPLPLLLSEATRSDEELPAG